MSSTWVPHPVQPMLVEKTAPCRRCRVYLQSGHGRPIVRCQLPYCMLNRLAPRWDCQPPDLKLFPAPAYLKGSCRLFQRRCDKQNHHFRGPIYPPMPNRARQSAFFHLALSNRLPNQRAMNPPLVAIRMDHLQPVSFFPQHFKGHSLVHGKPDIVAGTRSRTDVAFIFFNDHSLNVG